jgi:hypothetical protein
MTFLYDDFLLKAPISTQVHLANCFSAIHIAAQTIDGPNTTIRPVTYLSFLACFRHIMQSKESEREKRLSRLQRALTFWNQANSKLAFLEQRSVEVIQQLAATESEIAKKLQSLTSVASAHTLTLPATFEEMTEKDTHIPTISITIEDDYSAKVLEYRILIAEIAELQSHVTPEVLDVLKSLHSPPLTIRYVLELVMLLLHKSDSAPMSSSAPRRQSLVVRQRSPMDTWAAAQVRFHKFLSYAKPYPNINFICRVS